MENALENMFVVSIAFGTNQVTRLIFAVNKEDAIHTIKEYYSNPIIVFAMSYSEIKNLYDLATKQNEEDFYLVIERIREGDTNIFFDHYERNNNIEILYEKYKNKDCFFSNKEMIIDLVRQTEELLDSPEAHPIFSDLIIIDTQ